MFRRSIALFCLALGLLGPADAQNLGYVQNLNTPQVPCGSSATLAAAQRTRNAITLAVPAGGATVFVGGAGVTTSTGFPVGAGFSLTLQPFNGPVYCVVATGSQTLEVLESW